MSELVLIRAVPNPIGKDRTPANQVTNQQLNAEWMESRNATSRAFPMAGVRLSQYTFDGGCQRTGESVVMSFTGSLQPGYSVRVHTGIGTPTNEGMVHHLYAGHGNFVWNNRCGDTAVLRNGQNEVVDYAGYDPRPPEGMLSRVPGTHKLSATSALPGPPDRSRFDSPIVGDQSLGTLNTNRQRSELLDGNRRYRGQDSSTGEECQPTLETRIAFWIRE